MKSLIIGCVCAALFAESPAYRHDPTPSGITAGDIVRLCKDTACSELAASYTDATASTACPPDQPVVAIGSSQCGNAVLANGTFGFYLKRGVYFYIVGDAGGDVRGAIVAHQPRK